MSIAVETGSLPVAAPQREATAPQHRGVRAPLSMAAMLANRNLFHDRVSLLVTIVGIVFSVVLVAVQCGLYLGSERTIAAVQDNVPADLWIVPLGTKSFDDPTFLEGRERHAALSTPGVGEVRDLVVGFAAWRKPSGGTTAVLLVGSDRSQGSALPWSLDQGTVRDIELPSGVAVDRSYFSDLGVERLGDSAEINGQAVKVTAVTRDIRSFTTLPYVFTTAARARTLLDARAAQSSYTLVRLAPGADRAAVKAELERRLADVEVLTHEVFRSRSLDYWLFQTGAGAALIAGAILGLIVGIVVVSQTLYASTKDHLNEFATLRALGASAGYIHRVILMQALISATLGYLLGMGLALVVIWASRFTTLTIVMTPSLAGLLLIVTVGMCTLAALSAIVKVTRIDPAVVFSR